MIMNADRKKDDDSVDKESVESLKRAMQKKIENLRERVIYGDDEVQRTLDLGRLERLQVRLILLEEMEEKDELHDVILRSFKGLL